MTVINLTALAGKDVYTRNAKYVGKIDDSMIDTEKGNIYGFAINMAKESFLYKSVGGEKPMSGTKKTVLIPYREVLACDDIVIVTVPKQYERNEATVEPSYQEEDDVVLPGLDE